jgi:hypothetical protein
MLAGPDLLAGDSSRREIGDELAALLSCGTATLTA